MTRTPTPATTDSTFDALLQDVAHMPDVEPSDSFHEGDKLSPTLTLIRKLGAGGMSTVWEAMNTALGRRVAVKVLQRRAGRYATHEAAALERLRHPQIVRMYTFGVSNDGDVYIAMELLEGQSLAHHVRQRGPLSLRETCVMISQTADALSHAHAEGLLHRDIKPSNIQLVAVEGGIDARLIDFGISRNVPWDDEDSVLQSSKSAGTPGYMSPEQLEDPNNIDGRTDLWSLAATAHFALTGKRADPKVNAKLPAPIAAWFQRALSPVPRARFRTPREMAAAFSTACDDTSFIDPLTKLSMSVRHPKASPKPRTATLTREHVWIGVLVAAFVVWLLMWAL
jgi:serine/threonine-protein kinase